MCNRNLLHGWSVLGRTKALRIKAPARIWIRKAIPSPGRCREGWDTRHAGRTEWTAREQGNKWRLTLYSAVNFKKTAVTQLVRKLSPFYETDIYIPTCSRANQVGDGVVIVVVVTATVWLWQITNIPTFTLRL